jgi:hypothetical protein
MIQKYQYRLFVKNEIPWFLEEGDSNEIVNGLHLNTFETFALEGYKFQRILDRLQEEKIPYVLVGEDTGHIEKFGEMDFNEGNLWEKKNG